MKKIIAGVVLIFFCSPTAIVAGIMLGEPPWFIVGCLLFITLLMIGASRMQAGEKELRHSRRAP